MQLDFKKPLEVLSIASATAVYSIYGAVPVVQAYLRAVYHRLPSPSELQLPPDDIDRILQSGDSAACAMVTLAAVVLAPVVEELIFR
jgi:membrane protease YdiL (CAAX protease family)